MYVGSVWSDDCCVQKTRNRKRTRLKKLAAIWEINVPNGNRFFAAT